MNDKKENKIFEKTPVALREEAILKFWEENNIFEKSLELRKDSPLYSFYDGPPFATGTPHYGHIVASTMKDVVPRYWAMRGYRVDRKWGWDCHGLPIENIAEKELGITQKKEIVEMGVEKFNEFCRTKVLKYVEEWETVVKRLGRWVDMDHCYKTMDLDFMESVWWVFKELWDKGLIYEGHRVMHICTRCETTLSQSEVSEGYKMVKDLSVIVKFPITDQKFLEKYCGSAPTSFLAWTTTPWSVPTTMALAIGADFDYIVFAIDGGQESASANATAGEQFICAKKRFEYITDKKPETKYKVVKEIKGKEIEHIGFEHPFGKFYKDHEKVKNNSTAYKTHFTDYVSVEDGAGIVTINGAFGDIDMEAAKKIGLPIVVNVRMDGTFTEEMGEFAGLKVKSSENREATDVEIIKYLAHNNFLFFKEKYEHSYPHCWRCETPLINYATSSWFVNVLKVKARALELAKKINWSPAHIKEGRFGNWLEGARDWSISRQRFWASVIPIWRCDNKSKVESQKSKVQCDNVKVFGSVKELEELSGQKIADLHKHIVDKITFKCDKCGGEMRRVPDVLDTWFDSGSMPYAQMHYPFENKEKFDKGFPADFIAEGVDQTRAWFYYLHVIATAVQNKPAFKNVIVNGIVLAEDGKKMAKRLKNYPDPMLMFDKYGADALRFYLLSSPVVAADTINFKEADVAELSRGMFRMLWNSYLFFQTYVSEVKSQKSKVKSQNLLDCWIVSELNILIEQVNENMERYDLNHATKAFPKFIDNFSNWYIRRSRERFAKPESDPDRINAEETMRNCLVTLAKLLAPFAPFVAEEIYKNITLLRGALAGQAGEESVHFTDYPERDENLINKRLSEQMAFVREIVSLGLAARAKAKIKVRQPLVEIRIMNHESRIMEKELKELVKDELNIKEVLFVDEIKEETGWALETDGKITIALDTKITDELKEEGVVRDIARHIQTMRKDLGLTKEDLIEVYCEKSGAAVKIFANAQWKKFIKEKTITKNISDYQAGEKYDMEKDLEIEGVKIKFGVKKMQ